MRRSRSHAIAIVLTGLLVGGLLAAVPAAGEGTSGDGERQLGATVTMQANETPVETEIDCDRSRVDLSAPEDYGYDVTVLVANVTATTNEVSRSTLGSVEGNETVEFDGEGIVFVFVQDGSDDGEPVATAVTNCASESGDVETVERTENDPEIRVNCTESDVRFVAAEGSEYVAKVVSVGVSPTRSSTSSTTQTLDGNQTVSVDEDALVAAFASTGELGDDRTVSAIRNCSPYGPERVSDDGTAAETRTEGSERR